MCSPMLAIAAVSAVSTVAQGYAAKQKGEYENSVAQYNARVQENQAVQTANKGVETENIQRQRTAQILSQQRAQLGAANVSLTGGSALALTQDTSILGEADALRVKSNYGMQAQSLIEGAKLTRSQGEAARMAGQNAFTGSIMSAGASFVASSGVADKWFKADSVATQAAAPVVEMGSPYKP